MHTLSSIVPTILLIIHYNSITNAKSTNLFIRKASSTLKPIILSHNDDFAKRNENTKALHALLSIRAGGGGGGGGKRNTMKKKKKKRKSGQSKDGDRSEQKGLESSKSVIKEALKEDAATAMGDAIR